MTEIVEKVVANLHDNREYITGIENLKQALNHVLFLQKIYRVIKFYQNGWLEPYIDINTNQRKKSEKWFWKRSF